jgi:hypothetical protein
LSIYANLVNNPTNQGKTPMSEQVKLVGQIAKKVKELAKGAPVESRIYYGGVLDGMKIVFDLWRQDLEQEDARGQQKKLAPSSAELLESILKTLAAPRRRIAIRDDKGDIVESIETPII